MNQEEKDEAGRRAGRKAEEAKLADALIDHVNGCRECRTTPGLCERARPLMERYVEMAGLLKTAKEAGAG